MNNYFNQKETQRIAQARDSFSGSPMTNAQFDEGVAIVGIVKREIEKTGTFTEKLGDYADAFARTQKLARAETIIRDLFKVIIGKTMNQFREELLDREAKLTVDQKLRANEYASAVGNMIQHGNKISFNRAFAHQGEIFAQELGITDAAAKRLMKEEFKAVSSMDLYEWGKNLEEEYYYPQIDAERRRAEARRQDSGSAQSETPSRTSARTHAPSRSSDKDNAGGPRASNNYRRAARGEEEKPQDMSFERPAQRASQTKAPSRSRMRLSR